MTKTRLLATAAALALIAGAASAQDLKKIETPAPAPAAQQKAPAEKVAPNMHAGDRKLPETTGQASKSDADKGQTMDKGPAASKGAMEKSASEKAETKSDSKASTAQGNSSNATKSSSSASEKSNATTGQGAAAGAAKLTTEQRTKITSIIHEHKTPSVHLNVAVSVGTRIPTSVHLYPLPVEVINIYPEWRGYDYVLVGDEIVVIDPHLHEIVAIIAA
jgi:Protein of unknown function (DUF1236)